MPTDFLAPSTCASLLSSIPLAASLAMVGVCCALPGSGADRKGDGAGGSRGGPQGSALLLDTVPSVTADLARNLLQAEGIPVVQHSPDFDVAELGVAAHGMLRGVSVYVPASALARAREILAEAWGEDGEGELEADTTP